MVLEALSWSVFFFFETIPIEDVFYLLCRGYILLFQLSFIRKSVLRLLNRKRVNGKIISLISYFIYLFLFRVKQKLFWSEMEQNCRNCSLLSLCFYMTISLSKGILLGSLKQFSVPSKFWASSFGSQKENFWAV